MKEASLDRPHSIRRLTTGLPGPEAPEEAPPKPPGLCDYFKKNERFFQQLILIYTVFNVLFIPSILEFNIYDLPHKTNHSNLYL